MEVHKILYNIHLKANVEFFLKSLTQWSKSPKKTFRRSVFMLIRHSKYSVILSKIHSYGLLFLRFWPLGKILI